MSMIHSSQITNQLNDYLSRVDECLIESKYDYALAFLYRGLGIAEILADEDSLMDIYLRIIKIYHYKGQSSLAVEWCKKALQLTDKPNSYYCFYIYKLLNLLLLGRFHETQEILSQIESIKVPQIQWIFNTYSALLHLFLHRYLGQSGLSQAEEYLNKAKNVAGKLEMFDLEMCIYQGVYLMEEGLFYYGREEFLKVLSLGKSDYLQIRLLNELGKTCIYLYEYDEALQYLDQARKLAKKFSSKIGLNYNFFYRGLFYKANLDREKSKTHLMTALHGFYRVRRYPDIAEIYYHLYQLNVLEHPVKAKMYLEEYRSQMNYLQWYGEVPVLEEIYELVVS